MFLVSLVLVGFDSAVSAISNISRLRGATKLEDLCGVDKYGHRIAHTSCRPAALPGWYIR